jgi:CubicO group peptidase (beta-lactamase class C family)
MLIISNSMSFGQANNLETTINEYAKNNNFNGTILVEKANKTVFLQSFGFANRPFDSKNTNETKYKIASITKTFTAVLILQLLEQGKLELDKPIKTYLPNYKGEGADKITIHNLLTHSSGIENCEKSGTDIYELPLTSDSIITKYCSGKLENPVGSQFSYNNGDYMILGKTIEAIYKKTYQTVLKAQILTPFKLKNTDLIAQPTIVRDLADTYIWNDSTKIFEHDAPFYLENFGASGGLYSTVSDLALFANALFNKKILKENTLNLMLTAYPKFWNTAYSIWVTEQEFNGKKYKTVDRYGSIQGANTMMSHFLNENTSIIIFSNTNATDLGKFKNDIANTLFK